MMMCKLKLWKVACVTAAVIGLAASAAPVCAELVANGSFELPTPAGKELIGTAPDSWSASPNALNQVIEYPGDAGWGGNAPYPLAVDGSAIYCLESTFGGADTTGIQQDLGVMNAGWTYAFSATLLSHRDGWGCGYVISLYDVTDARVLASITEADFNPSTLGTKQSLPATFSYMATAAESGDTLRLILECKTAGASEVFRTGIDGVSVTATVPEPASIVMLAAGALGLLAYAWRKR